jgi:hypothetical protein
MAVPEDVLLTVEATAAGTLSLQALTPTVSTAASDVPLTLSQPVSAVSLAVEVVEGF